jgi:hypothetical protein
VISTQISRASATFLLLGGLVFLFAADVVLPRLIPGFPASGTWVGQLLAAAWGAVGTLNWYSQSTLLGGIYGRQLVLTNAVLYFVGATVILKVAVRPDSPAALWILVVPIVLFTGIYGWLLFRGPLERDFQIQRRATHA